MTAEQTRRIKRAIAETQALLAKEMRYCPDLRRYARIAEYERHIAKLQVCLEAGTLPAFASAQGG